MQKENARPSKAESSAVEQRQLTALQLHQSRGESRVDSRVLAEHLGNSHQHVRELLESYSNDFGALGVFRFETGKPPRGSLGGRPEGSPPKN